MLPMMAPNSELQPPLHQSHQILLRLQFLTSSPVPPSSMFTVDKPACTLKLPLLFKSVTSRQGLFLGDDKRSRWSMIRQLHLSIFSCPMNQRPDRAHHIFERISVFHTSAPPSASFWHSTPRHSGRFFPPPPVEASPTSNVVGRPLPHGPRLPSATSGLLCHRLGHCCRSVYPMMG